MTERKTAAPQSFEDDVEDRQYRRIAQYEDRKYDAALDTIETLRSELDAIKKLAKPSKQRIILPTYGKSTSEAAVLALLSDMHVEEEVRPETVQHRNAYNLSIAKKSMDSFFTKLVRLTDKERQNVKIETLVLGLIGDGITGNIHDENLETCLLRPTQAIKFLQDELLAPGLTFLLNHGKFKRIIVVAKDGNHPRITHKKRISTRAGNSLEWLMHHNLAARFPQIEWLLEESYLSYLDIFGLRTRFHHGDWIESRGGVGGLYPPMLRKIYQWNLSDPAKLTVCGHFHAYHPGGGASPFIANGSMIGYNPMGEVIGSAGEPPIQAFALIDKNRGLTVQMPILVRDR